MRIITFFCFLFVFNVCSAGTIKGTVEMIQTGKGYTVEDVYVLVKIVGTRSGQPACATDDRFSLNPASEWGKSMLSILLTAQATQKTVRLHGVNNCDLMGGNSFEEISYLRICESTASYCNY